jgi:DNA end-binding protein Ku
MKPRSIWTGHLKISLLTIPIRVYTALNEADRISFNQLHKDCHQRLKQHLVCPVHGKVEREHVVKGYEIEKERFVVIEPADLERVRLETTHTVDLVQFVQPGELDPVYFDVPYFVGPDGPVSTEAFVVLREALRKSKRIGIGQVVLSDREKLVAIKPLAKGLLMTTLRYAAEVRAADAYFDDLSQVQIDADQIALARQLIENKTARFDSTTYTDRYQAAVLNLIKAKLNGAQPIQVAAASPVEPVINLMEALKQSVAETAKPKALPERAISRRTKPALAA